MQNCRTCGQPLRRNGNLYICNICGMNYIPGQTTPLLSKFAPKNNPNLISSPDEKDIQVFIQRVTQKLIPIYKDYPQDKKQIMYQNREKLKQGLTKVTEGQLSFKKWFDQIKTLLGKHPVDMAHILLDSTEGLNSNEAKELRKGCEQFLQYISTMYNAGAPIQ